MNPNTIQDFLNDTLDRKALSSVVGGGRVWSAEEKEKDTDVWSIYSEEDHYRVHYTHKDSIFFMEYSYDKSIRIPKSLAKDKNQILAMCRSMRVDDSTKE